MRIFGKFWYKWENWDIYKWEFENLWVWSQYSHMDHPPPQIFWYTRHPKKVVGLRLQKKDYQLLIQSVWVVKNWWSVIMNWTSCHWHQCNGDKYGTNGNPLLPDDAYGGNACHGVNVTIDPITAKSMSSLYLAFWWQSWAWYHWGGSSALCCIMPLLQWGGATWLILNNFDYD